MKMNPLQFAVVREDPLIEARIIEQYKIKNVLIVCSGGCSFLSLKALFPNLRITAFDLNPTQINHTKLKINQLQTYDFHTKEFKEIFNIEDPNLKGLNQSGNFETLFRCFSEFIRHFILEEEAMREMFSNPRALKNIRDELMSHRYWPVAFSLYFSDPLLRTMFGDSAIQHAPKGSYPLYFQHVFEKGLQNSYAVSNYFLHHVLLGYYLDDSKALPPYLQKPYSSQDHAFHIGELKTINNIKEYDFIQLSNLMDWMSEEENKILGEIVCRNTAKGTLLLLRQLNNQKNVLSYFPDFEVEKELSQQLSGEDNSLFYSQITCLIKR